MQREKSLSAQLAKFIYPSKKTNIGMARYDMQEMGLPHKDGKPVLYPRMVLNGQINSEKIAEELADGTTFNAGEVNGLLMALARKMAWHMGHGYSVKLEGIGTFTPSLGIRKEKEREEASPDATRRNARSIEVAGVNFLPEKGLVDNTDRYCDLERASKSFRRSSNRYTPEQRLEMVRKYVGEHPYLTVRNYISMTGLRRTAATEELRVWASQPDSGIDISGTGSHRVYVRSREA